MTNFLVFSSVGDSTNSYFSWLSKNSKFDTAVVYYGNNEDVWDKIKKNATISIKDSGYIFPLLNKYFNLFDSYEQYLIVDDDIFMSSEEILNTFTLMQKRQYPGSSWSKDPKSYLSYSYAITKNTESIYSTNFIEQGQVFISGDVLKEFLLFCKNYSLESVITGWDILFSNFVIHSNLGDLKILDFYQFYNPHPNEKTNGREIDRGNKGFEDRSKLVKHFISTNPDFFKMLPDEYWGSIETRQGIVVKEDFSYE